MSNTHFPVVPIAQVPVPELLGGASLNRPVVLVVERNPAVAESLVEILNQGGYAAIPACDATDAVEIAMLMPPDLVIADAEVRDTSGIPVAAMLRDKLPDVKIVLLDGDESAAGIAFAVVEKPVQPKVLLEKVSLGLNLNVKLM